METLSPIEAIAPALVRTRRMLFQPFRFLTFLKLCLVAAITEGLGYRGSHSSHGSQNAGQWSGQGFEFSQVQVASAIGMVLLAIVVVLFLCYLVVRLRFALFNSLTRQDTQLRPGWRLYREESTRFFWLSIVVGICFVALLIGAVLPFIGPLFQVWKESRAAGHVLVGPLLSAILPLVGIAAGLGILGIAIDVIMRDFMLPHMALEGDTAGEAWLEVWDRVTSEKGAFLFYGILRVLMPIGAAISVFIIMIVPMVVLFVFPGVMIAMLHAAAMNGEGVVRIIYFFLEGTLGFVLFCLASLIAIGVCGTLGIAIREYALVFYGGRYQRLGEVLVPSPAPPAPTAEALGPA
jgi:hypothetical protein